jgi:FdhD protein
MSGRASGHVPALVLRREGASSAFTPDTLVVEEPLEIRIREEGARESTPFLVTMRTPGEDEDLAMGLLFSEGLVTAHEEVLSMSGPDDPRIAAELARNVLVVTLRRPEDGERVAPRRATVMGSACGVCGRMSIEDVLAVGQRSRGGGARSSEELRVPARLVTSLPEALGKHQKVFSSTGGLHAAGLFDRDGNVILVREDVGRHNAADKVIGALLRERRPALPIMLVSGRLAFEIVQKAVLAGVRILAAVSAPTSLAVELAEVAGVTLIGFLRGERFNAYTHPERILPGA